MLVDIATWQSIVEQLEECQDGQVFVDAAEDIAALARGEHPAGWRSWDDVKAELDRADAGDYDYEDLPELFEGL